MPGQHTHDYDLTGLLPSPRYCASCAERICAALRDLPGVIEVGCDRETGALAVTRDGGTLSARELDAAVRRIAAEEAGAVVHAAYRLTGLD